MKLIKLKTSIKKKNTIKKTNGQSHRLRENIHKTYVWQKTYPE